MPGAGTPRDRPRSVGVREERRVGVPRALGRWKSEVRPGPGGGHSPSWRPGEEPLAHQERLRDLLDGLALLAHRDRQRADADRTTPEASTQDVQHGAVETVETRLVDLEQLECGTGEVAGDDAVGPHLREVADAAEQPVGDPWGAAGPAGDL